MATPNTLEECFPALDTIFEDDISSKESFKNETNEGDAAIRYHNSLGRHLRNEWGLWYASTLKHYFADAGLSHADDISHHILVAYHKHLNGKEVNLQQIIEEQKKYFA